MPKADKRVHGIAGPCRSYGCEAESCPGPRSQHRERPPPPGRQHSHAGSGSLAASVSPHSMCPQSAASRPWGRWEGLPEPGWGMGGESRDQGGGISCTRAPKGFKAEAPSFPEVSSADPRTGPLRISVVRGEVTGSHLDCLLPPGPDGESVSLALRTPVRCPVSQPCGQFCTEKKTRS